MKKQATAILIIFSIVLMINPKLLATKTIVAGTITNNSGFIKQMTFEIPDHLSAIKIPVTVDSRGNFRLELSLKHPVDFYVSFGKNISLLHLYSSPGDSTFLKIQPQILDAKYSQRKLYQNITITGSTEKINNDLKAYNLGFYQMIDWNELEMAIVSYKPKKIKRYINGVYNKLNTFLKSLNKERQLSADFKSWAEENLKFWTWHLLVNYINQYPEYNKINRTVFITNLPKDYFDFLKGMDEITEDQKSSSFYLLMESLYQENEIECPINKSNFHVGFECFKNKVQQLKSPYIRDILFAKYYSNAIKKGFLNDLTEVFDPALIKDDDLKGRIKELIKIPK